jgi:hypothetical protein
MTTPSLPGDVARCAGERVKLAPPLHQVIFSQSQCRDCLRRTAPRDGDGPMIAPPVGIDWLEQRCPYRIAP